MPIQAKTAVLQIAVPVSLRDKIEACAEAELLSTSAYARRTLAAAVREATAKPRRAHSEDSESF